MRHGRRPLLILLSLVTAAATASADEKSSDPPLPRLGLSPGEPQSRSAPPSIPFSIKPAESKELVLDFHGYLLVPAVVGVHKRENPQPDEGSTVLHSPASIPQDLRSFEYTAVVPTPWVQLNFVYGNSTVAATAILATRALSDAAGFYNPVDQLGVTDAFLTVNLKKEFHFPFEVKVGAFTGRYGAMGAYDAGRYGTPLIARTNAIGETVTAAFDAGPLTIALEQGLGGQLNRPPVGLVPAGWNDFADPNVGASYVHHYHAGVSYAGMAQFAAHYISAWTQDDHIPGGVVPSGNISVLGADAHLEAGRFGHLYFGYAHTSATDANAVGGIIEVLNARGGPELIANYLGPNSGGNGSLSTFGAQYDLSLARMLFGDLYKGESPDVLLSLFTVGTSVKSNDPDYDGVFKLKAGGELTYSMLAWFGLSGRVDHVRLHGSDDTEAFNIMSGRLLFHTGWKSRDEFAIQYSHFTYGSHVYVKTGYPPALDPTANPDQHVLSLSGTFWW